MVQPPRKNDAHNVRDYSVSQSTKEERIDLRTVGKACHPSGIWIRRRNVRNRALILTATESFEILIECKDLIIKKQGMIKMNEILIKLAEMELSYDMNPVWTQ